MLGPLLDRIEVINVPAYLPVEKMNIAKNYLVPKFEEEYSFNEGNELQEKIQLTDASIMQIVNHYCGYEAGVRNLRKCIDRVFRKIVAKLEMQNIDKKEISIGDSKGESEEDAAGVGLHLVDDINSGIKEYQVNTKNLERFLDVAATDDHYYNGIN
jgi:Lon-like ATP-dependent protease